MCVLDPAVRDEFVTSPAATEKKTMCPHRLLACFLVISALWMLPRASQAQLFHKVGYKGVDASFGFRTFTLNSNVPELSGLSVLEEGGQLGVVFGNNIFRTKLGLVGCFYSAGNVSRTVDLFESDASFNFYPLALLKPNSFLRPYFTGGIVYDNVKFFGHYFNQDKGAINYSSSREPFLGRLHQLGAVIGAGSEFEVLNNDFDFVHIFSEVKYGRSVVQKASNKNLEGTSFSDQWIVSIGVRFGIRDGYSE
jgi:hypothetical protein